MESPPIEMMGGERYCNASVRRIFSRCRNPGAVCGEKTCLAGDSQKAEANEFLHQPLPGSGSQWEEALRGSQASIISCSAIRESHWIGSCLLIGSVADLLQYRPFGSHGTWQRFSV